MPYCQDILITPHADRASANLIRGPPILRYSLSSFRHKLVAYQSQDHLLPNSIGDTLFQSDDPFPSSFVDRVFPYRPLDSRMKEEVVSRRSERRGRIEMRKEGPERFNRRKGGNALDTRLVISCLASRRTVLKPNDPTNV
jgi:hypothetical protein